ncbi:MAG TPA: TRAP transporter small permease subunit [Woeseiaceae bacterium]|nr:TRAP transporter small permease subunit [Woeseiaceae bacterium]
MSNGTSRASDMLDRISDLAGRATAWLTLLMVLVTFVIVVFRYAFDASFIWLQESLTWMHAFVFMMGAAYTLQQEEHVRVDVFYRDMSLGRRALVNLVGVTVFLFPLCGFFIYQSYDYVAASWNLREISRDSGGLPYPAIPLLKSLLLLMPVTVALQGLSLMLRSWRDLGSR